MKEENSKYLASVYPKIFSGKYGGFAVGDGWFNIFVWPMAQMINFSFVPQHLQPVYVNILNIGWNTFLCYTAQSH